MIDAASLHELIGRWWWDYDAGNFDAFPEFFTSDSHFTCRTDTGTTDYEEFVRADVRDPDGTLRRITIDETGYWFSRWGSYRGQ